jgi:hypothetical protein
MRTDIKYLGLGLFIGLSATSVLLAGMLAPPSVAAFLPTSTMSSTPTAVTSTTQFTSINRPPTNTYTPTPTLIRLKTETSTAIPTNTPTIPTPTPTYTLTPPLSGTILDLLHSGYLSPKGPLSLREQIQVYQASLKYIRATRDESRLLGEQINGKGYGAPSDICGPLSIAILQDAGLIDEGINPHRFWLLNPDVRDDRWLLASAFPSKKFEDKRYKIKLNQVNWNKTKLYPGDFVYIYAGTGGTFEHMLVVNRVDADGRAYAVTNHKTPDGFVISEVLLYDPSNPDVGLFPFWTARPNAESGSTGFAGFEVWRLRVVGHPES